MLSKRRIGEVTEVGRSAQELIIEWRIPNFLSLSNVRLNLYESSRFPFCNGYWYLCLWPNFSSYVDPVLHRYDSETSVKTVNVTFGIKGSNGVEKRIENEWKFSNNDFKSLKGYCRRSELSEQKQRLMPDGVFTVICEMKVPALDNNSRDMATETDDDLKEPFTNGKQTPGKKDAATETDDVLKESLTNVKQSPGKKGVEELAKSLHELLAGEEDSDVRISVGGKEFPAHRAILQARSPVFKAMFAHDMIEKQCGVVTMEDCDPETFPDFLQHVYTGSVEMISVRNVFDLYRTSDKYDLSTLKMECTDFLKRNLTVASFCNTITLAIRHGDKDLTARATEFFCGNSLEIAETAEWQTFLQENTTVGNELFIKFIRHNENK